MTVRWNNASTLHLDVYQGTALTALGRPAAIHEGPSFVALTLAGGWEGARGSAGSDDFPESRPGVGEVGALLLFPRSHLLNIEWLRGDSTHASGVQVTGASNDCT